jgi:putative membrane protein
MTLAAIAILASLLGAICGMIPGLHLLSILYLLSFACPPTLPLEYIIVAVASLQGSWLLTSVLPTCFLSTPDESSFFSVMPAQELLHEGKGMEAVMLSAWGCQLGALSLLLLLAPVLQQTVGGIHRLMARHLYWWVLAIMLYLLQSEWPRPRQPGSTAQRALRRAWAQIGAGLLVFAAAGLLGCLIFFGSLLPPACHTQSLMPLFIGLFAMPWLVTRWRHPAPIPKQRHTCTSTIPPGLRLQAATTGFLGGAVAAYLPGVTGGVGGWLASQAIPTHTPHLWLVAQATTRSVYYVAGCAWLFLPSLRISRGGVAHTLQAFVPLQDTPPYTLPLYLAATFIGIGIARLLIRPLALTMLAWITTATPSRVACQCILLLACLVWFATGPIGVAILLTATSIGLLPQLLGCKRMHLLAAILLPVALGISGYADHVAALLHLP